MKDERISAELSALNTQTVVTILSIVGLFVTAVVFAYPVKWLWNWLVPDLFGLAKISAVQAWGLSMLAKFIFPRASNAAEKLKELKEKKI